MVMYSNESQSEGKNDHRKRQQHPVRPHEQQWTDAQPSQVPPEALIKVLMLLYNYGILTVQRFYSCGQHVLTELHLREFADEIGLFLRSHPVAAVIVAAVTVACGIPILIYVAFAIITIFLTFSGFLLIEGTVLAAGSVALLICLITMTSAFTVMGILGALLYCTFMQIASVIGVTSNSELQRIDSRILRVLATSKTISTGAHHRHQHSGAHQHTAVNHHSSDGNGQTSHSS